MSKKAFDWSGARVTDDKRCPDCGSPSACRAHKWIGRNYLRGSQRFIGQTSRLRDGMAGRWAGGMARALDRMTGDAADA